MSKDYNFCTSSSCLIQPKVFYSFRDSQEHTQAKCKIVTIDGILKRQAQIDSSIMQPTIIDLLQQKDLNQLIIEADSQIDQIFQAFKEFQTEIRTSIHFQITQNFAEIKRTQEIFDAVERNDIDTLSQINRDLSCLTDASKIKSVIDTSDNIHKGILQYLESVKETIKCILIQNRQIHNSHSPLMQIKQEKQNQSPVLENKPIQPQYPQQQDSLSQLNQQSVKKEQTQISALSKIHSELLQILENSELVHITKFNKANILYLQGNHAEAIQAYHQLIENNKNIANSYFMIGFLQQFAYKNNDDAIQMYEKCFSIWPNEPVFYSNIGIALFSQSKYDQSIQQHLQAIEFDPNYVESYNQIGLTLYIQGKFNEAMLKLDKSVILVKKCSNQDKKQQSNLIREYDYSIKFDPKNQIAHLFRGKSFYLIQKFDLAIKCFETAIKLNPLYQYAYSELGSKIEKQLGFCLYAQGETKQAIKQFDKVIQLKSQQVN